MRLDKSKRLNANMSTKRLDKLKRYAESKEQTMTVVIECWIDSLPDVVI
jgi:hypothetical protein